MNARADSDIGLSARAVAGSVNTENQTMNLAEKYRPTGFEHVIGQDKVIGNLYRLKQASGLAGRAYWLSGKSGTGKTTLAKLIAAEVADPINVEEIDAGSATVAAIQQFERESSCYAIGAKPGRAFIVNEAHGLRRDAVRQLLVTLERIPKHVVWVFTTTNEGEAKLFDDCDDANPLLSRCLSFGLASQGLAPLFAARAKEIAQAEGLDGKAESAYLKLVNESRGNMRKVLSEIEAGKMLG